MNLEKFIKSLEQRRLMGAPADPGVLTDYFVNAHEDLRRALGNALTLLPHQTGCPCNRSLAKKCTCGREVIYQTWAKYTY